MKLMNTPLSLPFTRKIALFLAVAALLFTGLVAQAHPYASGVTNDNGTIRFILNESGGSVDVVFEDNTTNSLGVLSKGSQSFALAGHTSFSIYVTKAGNGTPALISSDSYTNSVWNSPRGVDANKNPKFGNLFGRIYAGNSAVSPTNTYPLGTFKGIGLYAMNADQTDALGNGTNALGGSFYTASGGSGPWRLSVAPDNSVIVDDNSTTGASIRQFTPDLGSSTLILAGVGSPSANHANPFGTPFVTGSIATGDMVLWIADPNFAAPAGATLGPGTSVGSYNCFFRYDIGSGPLPWAGLPNYAFTEGLDTLQLTLRTEGCIGKDGKIVTGFGRANLSNPNLQVLDSTGSTVLYTSWLNTGGSSDPWRGELSGANTTGGTYAGVRVSDDGRYLASVDINNGVTISGLTNGVPDEGSIFGIANTPTTANARGMCWDAADNLYVSSSGQGLLRIYSLGITTTCVTSNDFTGTNGSFQLVLPTVAASVVATTPLASQNYGSPTPGVFRITLNQSTLAGPVTVNFTRGGTAAYTNHYSINTNETPNGVTINPNSVTFPAGVMPGGGNWSVDVKITPTALPVSTNTLTVVLTLTGGATYQAVAPSKDTVYIQNTGPQLLLLTATSFGATMYRGTTNDFAKFIITRYGDTNGPGNTVGNVTAKAFTVTNVSYFGTAVFPTDYAARAQRLDPAGDGFISLPVNGPTAIIFNPGDTVVTCAVGNPVAHADLNNPPLDVTIIPNLTNQVSGAGSTNGLLSLEGFLYNVGTGQITLTELDNRVGPEVVLYSNPLTNAADSVNWTLTFEATNTATPAGLPVVVPNYTNDFFSTASGGTNDFLVTFGTPIATDNLDPSIAMTVNGWNNALKMTVNKNANAPAGVNVYPQGQNFFGNYALRFNMYLSLEDLSFNNPGNTAGREFALFGVNHHGTNCIWRTDSVITIGNYPTNSDGQWIAVDAGSGSITPADYESYVPGPVPNNANGGNGLPSKVSSPASPGNNTPGAQNGVFKHPPFPAMNVTSAKVSNPGGGEAINRWVDVSLEITKQTNINFLINKSLILTFPLTNGLGLANSYTNGTVMLGYLDPAANISDNTAFAYFSNVRVVEVSPYILLQPSLTNSAANNFIVPQFSSLTFTSSATYASAPITNKWYRGTGAAGTPNSGVPTALVQSNSVNATSMTDSLTRTFNNPIDATNYMSVFSDAAGSVTSTVVSVEVVFGPTNRTFNSWATTNMVVTAAGPFAPTAFQWYFNTVSNFATATKLANSTHYAGATAAALTITNLASTDVGYYWNAVTNVAGFVIPQAATLTLVTPPYSFGTIASVGNNINMSFTSSNPADTASAFILQSAGIVTGPYTNNPAAITGTNPNFLVSVPKTGDQMFYRLTHK